MLCRISTRTSNPVFSQITHQSKTITQLVSHMPSALSATSSQLQGRAIPLLTNSSKVMTAAFSSKVFPSMENKSSHKIVDVLKIDPATIQEINHLGPDNCFYTIKLTSLGVSQRAADLPLLEKKLLAANIAYCYEGRSYVVDKHGLDSLIYFSEMISLDDADFDVELTQDKILSILKINRNQIERIIPGKGSYLIEFTSFCFHNKEISELRGTLKILGMFVHEFNGNSLLLNTYQTYQLGKLLDSLQKGGDYKWNSADIEAMLNKRGLLKLWQRNL